MTHREKVDLFVAEMHSRGFRKNAVAPPLFRLLWKLGIKIAPPFFLRFVPLALLAGVPAGVLWGVLWSFLQGRFGFPVPTEVAVFAGLLFGALFGVSVAGYCRLKARDVGLPSWNLYTGHLREGHLDGQKIQPRELARNVILTGAVIAVLLLAVWLLGKPLLNAFQGLTKDDIGSALSNSLSLSSILVLTALGLAITFGVMRVINMAHGELLMLGAYTAFVVTDSDHLGRYGFNLYWAIPISFLVVAAVGYVMEVCLIRFLYGRPTDTLLATWGVGLILQELVRRWFGTDLKPMHLPEEMQGHLNIGELAIPTYRVFIVGVTLLCLLAVYLWFYRTSFGLKIRAVVQNRPMAAAMGISTRRVDSISFAFASGLAGVAGCVLGHLYTVKIDMGDSYIVEAFMVVILGGMGQLAGTVGGGAIIGTSDSFVEKLIGSTPMAKVIVLVLVVILILIRPSGLFTTKERAYE